MESSADRYLHKKFKKQLNIDSNNVEKEEKTIECNAKGNESLLQNCGNFGLITGVYMSDTSVANNEDNVPKLSTNNTNTFSIVESSNVVKSSISHVNIVNAVKQSEKNANVLQEDSERSKQAGELVDPQSSNSCISYVIPNSNRVEYYTPPELQFRAVNFDTRFNVSEPIPSADTSSILDNVYSKQYVTSKLVNVEKAGDISSNSSLVNDHGTNQEECYNNIKSAEAKNDNHVPELSSNEKSSTGKYICSYCNLACSKPSVLQKHIRAHTNERPYPCISCGFSFKTRSNLYKHCRSRTHANRVLGNKAQEIHNEIDVDSQNKMEYSELNNSFELVHEDAMAIRIKEKPLKEERSSCIEKIGHDGKSKPYKPRFHTAKAFFEDNSRDNQKNLEDQKVPVTVQNNRPSNSALLSLHISEVINKNNAIINSNEPLLLRKRSLENNQLEVTNNESLPLRHNEIIYPQQIQTSDERTQEDQPLNLTNKGRKRCLSEATPEPTIQTSLIKELLLKNLYADSMQCPHCKMIFQTVTELELHKLRSCKAFIKTGARYSRSSSVNVASILTKNKNAFADIPHLQNTTFPLKSPGPFLGKTRLVESDKSKSFSFDDGLPNFQSNLNNSNDLLKTTLRYSLSPLTIQHDRNKKTPVKMFGGEVKITQTSGEIKSFKIDCKDDYEKYGNNGNFPEFGSRLSENRVVKSCLQSGGTVVQNKPNYSGKQDMMRSSPEIIRVYENKSLSPNIDIVGLEKNKFSFERSLSHDLDAEQKLNSEQSVDRLNFQNAANSYKYPNIMDFSQNAVKQIAPNIKQPNLTIPGLPVPNRLSFSRSSSLIFEPKHSPPKMFDPISFSRSPIENARPNVINFSEAPKPQESEKHLENIRFAQKQILLQQNMTHEPPSSCITSPNVYNPLHLMVNGKVVRYVPGIPGPIAAEVPTDVAYGGSHQPTSNSSHVRPQKCNTRLIVTESASYSMKSPETRMSTGPVPKAKSAESATPPYSGLLQIDKKHLEHDRLTKSPKFSALHVNISEPTTPKFAEMKSPNIKTTEIKSPAPKNDIKLVNNLIPPSSIVGETAKKFARPNTLALKPSLAAHKQHHGLTPTMFNQILISPDTPRVAKKYMQHFLHGNYFSYLGLKSSTKPVYCTLNKTQPFYVPHHFKKLSMYSEWRQQDIKGDKLYASCYDPRQRQQKYVMAGRGTADLIVHSSYKFVVNESCSSRIEDHNKANSILGGYESNEDYTYVRGRGRGRYVCDQCGIRCKKPSMLKKHIRTHTNDRPYTCSHCNFSFKTKGNLTKHMKSKAHTKNYTASSSSSSSTQQSGTPSSESDTDDSGMDSSDESTRQQEHEAAYGLLSLSQKTTHNKTNSSPTSSNSVCSVGFNSIENRFNFMNTEQITQVNNSNFAKNKILDQVTVNFIGNKIMNEIPLSADHGSKEMLNVVQFLGRTNTSRPLTYPYTSEVMDNLEKSPSLTTKPPGNFDKRKEQFSVERRSRSLSPIVEHNKVTESEMSFESNHSEKYDFMEEVVQKQPIPPTTPILKVNDCVVSDGVNLKRKLSDLDEETSKLHKPHIEFEAMDLSMPSSAQKHSPVRYNGDSFSQQGTRINHQVLDHRNSDNYQEFYNHNGDAHNVNEVNFLNQDSVDEVENVVNLKTSSRYIPNNDQINVNYVYQESNPTMITTFTEIPSMDYDNSAMETLADVATKQVKLEKNTLAKSVASEYLKLATKQECQSGEGIREGNNFISSSKEVNEMIVKSEENKSCSICAKSFNKPSQLRLHMNIHYLERPFRCDPCSVSFRTKGHLQKHERSASHHNKLSSSPLLSSSEPRPFKCSDCNIAFRIHGHLAKHLRSKMHIMKLECLAKIPFGLYAELERANSLLTEINTTDGDQCLESLKVLAKKVFMNDPSKLNQLDVSLNNTEASDS